METTSKIIESKHYPSTTVFTAKPQVSHPHAFLNASGDHYSTMSMDSLFQCLPTLSVKNFFPNLQLELAMPQHEAIPCCCVAGSIGEEPYPHLAPCSCQGVEESKEVTPEPPLLQIKPLEHLQLFRIRLKTRNRLVLQTLPLLCCPSLDKLQPLNVSLVMRGTKPDTALEVPH